MSHSKNPQQPLDVLIAAVSQRNPAFRDELNRLMAPFVDAWREQKAIAGKSRSWVYDPRLKEAAKAVADLALRNGLDPNVVISPGGNTILHELVISDVDNPFMLEALDWLLERGADPNVARDDGLTPYALALQKGRTAVAEAMRRSRFPE